MKQTILIGGGVVVLIALLAGAAFVAGGMWGTEAPPDEMPVGAPGDALAGASHVLPGEGEADASLMVEIQTSDELPQRAPDTLGVFSRREDNRIFVSSGDQGIMFTLDGGVTSEGDTKEVEVVVTSETRVYEDVTDMHQDVTEESLSAGLSAAKTMEQELDPGLVEEIGESSIVMAWGEKRGERLVAEILVYTGPPVIVRSP